MNEKETLIKKISTQKPLSFKAVCLSVFIGILFTGLFSFSVYVFASPPDSAYQSGETLDPSCVPGDTNCTVTTTVTIDNGGTGQTSYTNGQLLIGNTTGNTLTKATLTGTANQITVTNSTGSITLSTPQNIHTSATPQFSRMGIGGTSSTTAGLYLSGTPTAGVDQYGIDVNVTFGSDATTSAQSFISVPATAAAAYTIPNFHHFRANDISLGAGSAVTNQYGFYISDLTGATNNYGIFSNVSRGTGKYNIYLNGTADNFLAGKTGFGAIPAHHIEVHTNATSPTVAEVGLAVRYNASNPPLVIGVEQSSANPWIGWNANQSTLNAQTFARTSGIAVARLFQPGTVTGALGIQTSAAGTAGNTIVWNQALLFIDTGEGSIGSINPTTSQQLLLSTVSTTKIGTVIRGVASQSANLQEWQNSSAGILSSIDSSGILTLGLSGTQTGTLKLNGTTSGTVTVTTAAAAGTWTLTLPTTGGTNKYPVTTDGSGTLSFSQLDLTAGVTGTLPVANGGTGQTSYTNGQLLIGNTTGNTLTKATLTGTANQITVTNSTGSITLSTPQNIHTSATPQFGYMGLGTASVSTQGLTILLATATDIGLVVKGAAAQSGNLQEWQDEVATVLTSIASSGQVIATTDGVATIVVAGACSDSSTTTGTNGTLCIDSADGAAGRIYYRFSDA